MRKHARFLLAICLSLTGCTTWLNPAPTPGNVRWAAYYHNNLPAAAFARLDLVIFDRRYHPDFKPLTDTDVYAYVSAGEVADDVPQMQRLAKKGLLLRANEKWKSHVVDITAPLWREIVLAQVADAQEKGFTGVMLDTLDSPLDWAQTQEPPQSEAFQQAAIQLILAIRKQYPDMKIILNRAFVLLPKIAQHIDYALAESIASQPGDSSGQFALAPAISYTKAVTQLRQATAFAPQLQILTLDYWNQDDVDGVQTLYAKQRANGFSPYVTTPDLHHFTPEPTPAGRPIDQN